MQLQYRCSAKIGLMDADKKVRFNRGYGVSFGIIAVAAFGWIPLYDFEALDLYQVIVVSIAKTAAFGGLAMFAWSLILSARYKILDSLFRGLDKMYIAHRLFGTLSVALLLLHPIALTIKQIPEGENTALGMWISVNDLKILLGMTALYGLIGIALWSNVKKSQHERFIQIHKLLGFLFMAGALHAFMTGTILSSSSLYYWFLLLLSIAGSLSFVHYSLLADFLHAHYVYVVHSVKCLPGDLFDIRLTPKYRILKFLPGQFVYIRFDRLRIHGYHPFTIASGTKTSQLQFLVKRQGDFTSSLNQLRAGDPVRIRGPYGGFTMEDSHFDRQLWIAGGVGITPFLSKLRSLPYNRAWPKIDLIYATRTKSDAVMLKELTKMQHVVKSFHLTHLHENKFGVVSLHDMQTHFGDLSKYAIFICGPPPMLNAYMAQAEKLGIQNQLFFEEFSY